MEINEKHRILGEAIINDYSTHGKKEIAVSFTDSPVLKYLTVSIDGSPIVGFSEREMEKKK